MPITEFENIKVKQQRIAIYGLTGIIIITIMIEINGFYGFATILNATMFLIMMIVLLRKRELHTTAILGRVQEQFRKDTGRYISVKNYTQGNLGDKIYYYFPEEHYGIEYDMTRELITAKLQCTVMEWNRLLTSNRVITKLTEESFLKDAKTKIMEESGHELRN